MKDYKKNFISFLLNSNALKFGEFTLKSGRLSPYFLNTGMLYSGKAVNSLGMFYASAIVDNVQGKYSAVFGPSYKGIPLAVATVASLFSEFNINTSYTFNRKETKDHGDGGLLVGKQLSENDRIILVDDVITAGTAVRESIDILKKNGNPELAAIIISVDRMEKGTGEKSAIQEITETIGLSVYPIVTILDIIDFLKYASARDEHSIGTDMIDKMESYRETYGVS
jgi:orotate phosphoribosyltransferase